MMQHRRVEAVGCLTEEMKDGGRGSDEEEDEDGDLKTIGRTNSPSSLSLWLLSWYVTLSVHQDCDSQSSTGLGSEQDAV